MLSNLIKEWIIFLCFLLEIQEINSDWLNHWNNYLKDESQPYQGLLLFDETEKLLVSKTEEIIFRTSRILPAQKLNFQEATLQKALELSLRPEYYAPQSTTLLMIIKLEEDSQDLSEFYSLFEFMTILSGARSRPKCLIILSQETKSLPYDKLLRILWSKQFIDVTILELSDENVEEKHKYLNSRQERATLHQFNPFTNVTKKTKYSSKVFWFPDKTRNLHNQKLMVGIFDFPPAVFLQETHKSKNIINPTGIDIMMTKALSRAMNFNILWMTSKETHYGIISCIKEKITGFIRNLLFNEIQLIGMESSIQKVCGAMLHEFSRASRIDSIGVVVPILADEFPSLSMEWKLLNAMELISLFLFVWILAKILGFESYNWNLFYLIPVVLGMCSPSAPNRLAERIVFGSMLFACLLYSSIIYTAFTDVSFKSQSVSQLETIEDVIVSSLEPIINKQTHFVLYPNTEGNSRLLLDKSTQVDATYMMCIDRLIRDRNVACIAQGEILRLISQNRRDREGQPMMNVIKEPISITATGFPLEAGSPYLARINKIMLRFIQSGLSDKWRQMKFDKSTSTAEAEEVPIVKGTDPAELWVLMTYSIGFGYSCSILIFLCEVLFHYGMKNIRIH